MQLVKKTQYNVEDILQLHRNGQLQEAKQAYLAILDETPDDIAALHFLGVLYAEEGDLEKAQRCIQQAIALKPNDPTLILHLANLYKAQGLYQNAQQLLQELVRNHPEFAAGFNNLGTVYYGQEQWQDAVNAYQAAIDIQPNYIDAYYNLGLTWNKLHRFDAALQAFAALLELAPEHPGAQFQQAILFMREGKLPAARDRLETLAKAYPYHVETQSNLALCYLRSGNLDRAAQHYLNVLDITPQDVQALFNLGVINMQLGHIDEAVKYYSNAVKQDNDLYEAHNNLGFIFLIRQDKQAALTHFREALRLRPDNEALQHTINIITQDKKVSTSPPAYIESLFDSYADHFDTHLKKSLHYQVPQLIYQAVKAHASLNDLVILDLGCGTGLTGELFKKEARALIGVDLSGKMLEVAAQKNIYAELVQAEVGTFLADKHDQYDVVLAGDVLVYTGDLVPVFAGVQQALKPGGLFVFNVEKGETEDYSMTASGRFTHKRDYVDKAAGAQGLQVVAVNAVSLRTQAETSVQGYVYVLRKTG